MKYLLISLLICGKLSAQNKSLPDKDTIPAVLLISLSDTSLITGEVYWHKGWCVRTKHNNTEGKIDPYFEYGFTYKEYMQASHFLLFDKRAISKNIVLWDAKY